MQIISWTDQRESIFRDRYALKNTRGEQIESVRADMWKRVASQVGEDEKEQQIFYHILSDFKFVPSGRILCGDRTFYNCFVLGLERDSRISIMTTISELIEVTACGGGAGVNWSILRPSGSHIKGVNGKSSGPVTWMKGADALADAIKQGGSRTAALMFMLDDWHPDVLRLCSMDRAFMRANFSINLSDKFMQAVDEDSDWDFEFPDIEVPFYDLEWDGNLDKWKSYGFATKTYRTIRARELFRRIAENAHVIGSPGVAFLERCNKMSNTYYLEDNQIVCMNPCFAGETPLLTKDGYKAIEDLVGDVQLVAVDGSLSKGKVWEVGIRDIVEVRLSNGESFRCTPEHEFLSDGKRVMVKDLVGKKLEVIGHCKKGPTIKSISPCGKAVVYDFNEPKFGWGIVNGFIAHNCGEQPLPAYGCCNLGAINLVSFYEDGKIDMKALELTITYAVRFLDRVIDISDTLLPQIRVQQEMNRRIGLGTMGLADLLILMKIRYGSEESLQFIDRLYSFIRNSAYKASVRLAVEKGAAKGFDRDKFLRGAFVQTLPNQLQEKIYTHGIRNLSILTQAPTGTTSLLAGVSSGIEPIFRSDCIRSDATGKSRMIHPLFNCDEDYLVTSERVTVEEHINVQAQIQRCFDSSISKTINMPEDSTVEDIMKAYQHAHRSGCKGVTVYRLGSLDDVLKPVCEACQI
jgi:ribonucleotide reductase alpha subunit